MKRIFDLIFGSIILLLLLFPMLLIAIAIHMSSNGPIFYWSNRIGINNIIFKMPKFRSMLINTPALATHLLEDKDSHLTPIGSFLRRTSLDELPQLFSVIIGDMSLVGPRPALFNQDDLIAFRTKNGIDKLLPGITGWAQVNGRDELPMIDKVRLDVEYLKRGSFWFDIKILLMTILKVLKRNDISH